MDVDNSIAKKTKLESPLCCEPNLLWEDIDLYQVIQCFNDNEPGIWEQLTLGSFAHSASPRSVQVLLLSALSGELYQI